MRGADLIVGTAGHIDHGKTAMVRTLTGIELDALPEEVERGITIALGFTPFDLPGGSRVAFVDVPGHERLVRTMVAGATGVGAALLCISADDGVMPQTREHLAILDLLGVKRGAIVLTKADLVDEELLELALDDARDVLEGTFLEDAPIVPFSAVDGTGHDALIEVLDALAADFLAEGDPALAGPFRLPVDRSFTRQGFGTVVTGTVWSGELSDGDQVELLPQGGSARVRGLQVHGEPAKQARPGWRVALNLSGVERESAGRGTLVATGPVPCPLMLDARLQHVAGATPLENGDQVRVLLGTQERVGRLYFAGEIEFLADGKVGWVQLRMDGPLPCMPGDRFVLRRVSPVETLGGGIVVDPWTRRMRNKQRALWEKQLQRLHGGEARVWLERASEEGLEPEQWAFRGGEGGEKLGGRVFDRTVIARLEGGLLSALTQYHVEHPLSLGAHRRELRRGRLGHLPERVFDDLVARVAEHGMLEVHGPIIQISGFEVALTLEQVELQETIEAAIAEAGFAGLAVKALHERFTEPSVEALVRLLESQGKASAIPKVGWIAGPILEHLVKLVRAHFTSEDALTAGQFKDLSGLTRKSAIPLLEWLDKSGITRREGDVRRLGTR